MSVFLRFRNAKLSFSERGKVLAHGVGKLFGRNDEADSAVEFCGILTHANEFDRKVPASALELRKIPVDEAAC